MGLIWSSFQKTNPMEDRRWCPECMADWKGKLIPKKFRHLYSKGSIHYSRLIGIEIQGGYDGVAYWECPDCQARWDRFTGEKVEKQKVKKEKSKKRMIRVRRENE